MSEGDDDDTSGAKPTAKRPAPRPTVVPAPGRTARKSSRDGAPRAKGASTSSQATPPVTRPTAIPGTERRRIDVSARDLQRLSPGAAAEVYQRALELLGTFVVEKTTERKAILWGHELQKVYSDLVTETLALSQAPLVRKVEGYLTRMMEILASIDLMAVAGRGNTGLGRMFKSVNSKIDTPEELRSAQAELDQLVKYLNAALDELLDLRDRLEQHSRRINKIGLEVEASALAALFLSHHLQGENAPLAQRFTERSMSLTQTLAQIRSADSVREIQIEQPIRMVRAVQDVALVMMPGFLGNVASALALIPRKGLTQTQAGELTYQIKGILQALET